MDFSDALSIGILANHFIMLLRFLKLGFGVRYSTCLLNQVTSSLCFILATLLFSHSVYAQENSSAAKVEQQAVRSEQSQAPQQVTQKKTQEKRPLFADKDLDWSETTIEEPQFDLHVTSSDKAIQSLLREHMELYQYRMLSDLTNLELRRLLQHTEKNIAALTSTLGYFSPQVDIKVTPSDQREDQSILPLISIHVEPGEITTISKLELLFQGHIEESKSDFLIASMRRRLQWGWAMREKDAFTQSDWSSAKSTMLSRLTSQYYAAGKISRSKATIDPDDHTAELSITLDSGPRFYLGDYKVETLNRYSERLVRNFARLKAGDDYLLDELQEAQQRLSESGYFDAVYVYVMPDDPNPERATIHVNVQEAYRQEMTIGPGYSTDNGARLTFAYRHNEVPLLGWQLNSELNINQESQYIEGTLLSIPEDDYWRWFMYGKLQNEEKNDERTKSIQGSYGKNFTSKRIDRAYFIQYDRAQTENLLNKEEQDISAVSANFAITWRKFNNYINPRSGWGIGLELGAGSSFGDSSAPFVRTRTRGRLLLPFERRRNGHFILRGEIGGVFIKEGYTVPKPLLFLTGGDTTVRGYSHQSIDVNGTGDKVTSAGKYLLVGSLEYQRPIILKGRMSDFSWAAFVDTGSVANKWQDLNLHTGVGVGARWNSPVGPLNVDLGYGLKSESIRLHFNIGFNF